MYELRRSYRHQSRDMSLTSSCALHVLVALTFCALFWRLIKFSLSNKYVIKNMCGNEPTVYT